MCIPNIGVKNRRMRRNFGLAATALGVVVGVGLILVDAPVWTRFALTFFFFNGMIGIFQAREQT